MSNFFTLPDKEKSYKSYMVYMLALIWWVVTAAIVSTGFYFFPDLWIRWLTLLGISIFIAAFNLTLNYFGNTRLASWSLTIMLWLYITIPCYSAGGIMASGIMSQMSIILTAGFLLGWRGGLTLGLLTMGTDFGLAYIELTGHLPNPTVVHNPITRWISTIIPFSTILALQYYATIDHDITEQRESLEKLRASQERYGAIITVSNTGAWEYNLETDLVWYSAQYFAMLGFDRPEGTWDNSMGNTWIERLHPDDRDRSKIFDEFLKGGSKGLYENVFRMQHKNGDWVWISSRARRLRDPDGNLTNMTLGTHIDISERIHGEEKIKQSGQLLKKITSQVPGNTYMFEIEGNGHIKILFSNRGTDPFNHSQEAEEPGEHSEMIREILHDDDKARFNDSMKEAAKTHTAISFQYRTVAEGHIRWRWMQAIPEKDKAGKVVWYGATSDITPLVDYIASIEQVIFDIGHVIRRPISSMMGMTKLVIESDLSEKEIKEFSEKLYQISDEMDKFIRELNVLYHEKRQNTKLNIDVSSVIDERGSLFNQA